jgi:SLT domain-containing protein
MSAAAISALWIKMGGAKNAAANMAKIAMAESADLPSNVQKGQPPHLTGWGLYQITPTSGINQNGAFGNLLNASNNTRAAISLYNKDHYSPWTSDPVGAGLSGYAGGTSGAAPGWALVGEQGVEAVRMRGGEQVLSHSATLASGKLGGHGYASGTAGSTITFGDIHIHYGGSPSDPGAATHNAQETVRAIKAALAREDLVDKIATGVTH